MSSSEAEIGPQILKSFKNGDLGKVLLVPGDPDRVAMLAELWDDAERFPLEREFQLARGRYHGAAIAALSTGMGGPSLEVILMEAIHLDVETFIRVGTTGALQNELRPGELVINEASVRLDGTSASYVRAEYPAAASYEVTAALVESAKRLSIPHHVGIGATTASFYAGQDRPTLDGFRSKETEGLLDEMRNVGVLNFEMEAATLFTLARLHGRRAGAVCSVIAHRLTGEWDDAGGIERACRVASEAVTLLR